MNESLHIRAVVMTHSNAETPQPFPIAELTPHIAITKPILTQGTEGGWDVSEPEGVAQHNYIISLAGETALADIDSGDSSESRSPKDDFIDLLFKHLGEATAERNRLRTINDRLVQDNQHLDRRAQALLNLLKQTQSDNISLSTRLETDEMTGILNATGMQKRVREFDPANGKIYIATYDIGDFKHVNDTLGHAKGDELLGHVAFAIALLCHPDDLLSHQKSNQRVANHVGRPHGDEFIQAFQVPGDTDHTPTEIMESIRSRGRTIRDFVFAAMPEAQKVPTFHVDVGITEYDPELGYEGSLQEADRAMYKDKQRQRKIYGHVERTQPSTTRQRSTPRRGDAHRIRSIRATHHRKDNLQQPTDIDTATPYIRPMPSSRKKIA